MRHFAGLSAPSVKRGRNTELRAPAAEIDLHFNFLSVALTLSIRLDATSFRLMNILVVALTLRKLPEAFNTPRHQRDPAAEKRPAPWLLGATLFRH